MIISDMEIRLFAELTRLGRDMNEARRMVGGAMDHIGLSVDSATDAFKKLAAGLTIAAFAHFVKGAIDAVDALNDLSARTNVSVEDLAGLAYGAQLSGTQLEAVGDSISKLTLNMGKDPEAFKRLGLTAKEPIENFKALADIFKDIQDPQLRAAFGAETLGKQWQESAILLAEGRDGIEDLMQKGKQLSGVTEQVAADAGKFNDKVDLLGMAVAGAGTRIAAELLPMLNLLTDELMESGDGATGLFDSFSPVTETFRALVILGGNVAFTFKAVGSEIGAIAAQLAAYYGALGKFVDRDWAGGLAELKRGFGDGGIGDLAKADAEKSREAFDKWEANWLKIGTAGADAKKAVVEMTAAEKAAAEERTKAAERLAKEMLADKDRQAAAKKAAGEYAASVKAANDFVGAMQIEASQIGLTADQVKMMTAARAAAKAPTAALRMEIMAGALALDVAAKAGAVKAEADKAQEAAVAGVKAGVAALNDERASSYAAAVAEAQANELLVETFGMSKTQIEAVTIARMEARLAQRGALELDDAEVAQLERLIDAKKRNAAAVTKVESLEAGSDVTKAKELLDILSAVDAATRQAAAGMTQSFGSVGTAIGGLTTALSGYAVQQQAIAAQLAVSLDAANGDTSKIAKANAIAAAASAQAQVKSYGDMAGAAKGFFKENSKGYKALETAEKAYRAYEMAMALEAMVKKVFFKEGEVAANLALNATKLTGEAATTTASVGLAGTEASAWGVTAVVKALASLPFPLNLAAGAATLAAVVAIGAKMMGGVGGGGVDVAKERQESAGTGTVLGDESAKSESLAKALELAAKNSSIELTHTGGMLSALITIRDNISNLASLAVQTTGLRATALDEKTYGVGSSSGFLGIGSSSTTIKDSGINIAAGQTVKSILESGIIAQGYADIEKKKSGLWGLGSSTKTSRQTTELDDALTKQLGLIVASLRDGTVAALDVLGIGGEKAVEAISNMGISIGEISFKDLTGAEIEEQLNAIFSKVGDDMAAIAVPDLSQFQKVGEGLFETLTRVAANYANLDSIMESLGSTFGATGVASITARERFISLSGGIDELASQTSSFADNFLSEAERLAPVQKYVTDQLAALGYAGLDTRDKFKDAVTGLINGGALLTEKGATTVTGLLAVSDAFAKVYAASEDFSRSAQDIADERKDLQAKLDELMLTSAQRREQERASIAAGNLALYDQINAINDLAAAAQVLLGSVDTAMAGVTKAVNAQKTALSAANTLLMASMQTQIDAATASVSKLMSLSDALHSALGSVEIPEQAAANRAAAQAQIAAALAIGKAGGALPSADSLKDALATIGKDSSSQFSSFLDYQRDQYRTANDLSGLADLTDSQVSIEQQMLDALTDQKAAAQKAYADEVARLDAIVTNAQTQVDALNGINTSVLSVVAALAGLSAAISAAMSNPISAAPSTIVGAYNQYLGRDPEAGAIDYWSTAAGNGVDVAAAIKASNEAKIQELYASVLGRSGDSGGVGFWTGQLNSGSSLEQIRGALQASDEYKNLPKFELGGDHYGGARLVGEAGPEIEVTGPSRIFNATQTRSMLSGASGSTELLLEVRRLSTAVDSLLKPAERAARATEDGTMILRRATRGKDSFVTRDEAHA